MYFIERMYRRFNYQAPVIFQRPGMATWDHGLTKDISEGGFFIWTTSVPSVGELLELRLINLLGGNMIHFSGKVARVTDKTARGPGLGIELAKPGASSELKRLCEYLGQNVTVGEVADAGPSGTYNYVKATTLARTLLENVSFMNYYQLLGVTNAVLPETLRQMRASMIADLNLPVEMMQAGDRQLLGQAMELVSRVMGILGNPQRRMLYDLSLGEADPTVVSTLMREERLDPLPLREQWNKKFPDRIPRAAGMWQESQHLRNQGKLELARELAAQAGRLDPFNPLYHRP